METQILSIGIIFKNEIRCIERCLKSLEPLRNALPCELVMADTGATDGSREIAEKYADILIDFPWVNDFSAARNAVMDRCSGKWYMSIDCDEWVDEKVDGFVHFLTGDSELDFASIIIRNYYTTKLERGAYADFVATRLMRLSTGLRYVGTVHERWHYEGDLQTMLITDGMFHHDGYITSDQKLQKEKAMRNMALLRKQLEEDPDNLITLNQCIDSSFDAAEREGYVRRALAGVAAHWSQWELFGAPTYCHAVKLAMRVHLPELEQWLHEAEEMFPDSIFLRVELAYYAFGHYWEMDDFDEALRWGERYVQGVADYRAGNYDRAQLLATALDNVDEASRINLATVLSSGYLHVEQPEKCAALMAELDPCGMNWKEIADCVSNFRRLHREFGWDVSAQLRDFWARLNAPEPDKAAAAQRRAAFLQAGGELFSRAYRESETQNYPDRPHGCTVFLPLSEDCALGLAAEILNTEDADALAELLGRVEKWAELPAEALLHALERGVRFPLKDRPMQIEEMDGLALRLAQAPDRFFKLTLKSAEEIIFGDWQMLVWTRGLVLAAVKTYPWPDRDPDEGMALLRAFAKIERAFLELCYTPESLQEERLFALPPMHRFGWYLIRALDALEQGNELSYVRLLRSGLTACEEMKGAAEFLLEHLLEMQRQARIRTAPPELLEMADRVRLVLARFAPDDPAVVQLKASPQYQQVAWLLEPTGSVPQ